MRKTTLTAVTVAALLALTGCGGGDAEQVTPAACLDALDAAEEQLAAGSEVADALVGVLDAVPDLTEAASSNDVDAFRSAQADLEAATAPAPDAEELLESSAFGEAAAVCRGLR